MSIRPYYALAHVASQISSFHLPVAHPSHAISSLYKPSIGGLDLWTREHWYEFLQAEQEAPSGLLPWLPRYLSKWDPDAFLLLDSVYRQLAWCAEQDANYILLCDSDYPHLLRHIPQPPLGLSVLGAKELLACPKISVVGSRRTADLVLKESYQLGYKLALLGLGVVSGGAFGCDLAVHSGVLASRKNPLPAIVVFANGLQTLYPQSNQRMFLDIYASGGVLLSEKLYHQIPKPYDFPIRNRIISGLSRYTLVMGASQRSGAMTTARHALDQGREVCVFIPKQEGYFNEGCHELRADGAASFASAEELCNWMLA